MKGGATDWDTYYEKPAPSAKYTRRYTESWLISVLRDIHGELQRPLEIIEFGGANSFCSRGIVRSIPTRRYDVADFNLKGLGLFTEKMAGTGVECSTSNTNLLQEMPNLPVADVVFSVGLVEHFTPAESKTVAGRHFDLVRPNGWVIITAPTPTLPYRLTRGLAEWLGLWAFPDERPMSYQEVEGLGDKRGRVLAARTLWPLVLTQRAVVWRATRASG